MSMAGLRPLTTTSCTVALLAVATSAGGQEPVPEDSVLELDPVVVTAARSSTPLTSSIASVSLLTAPRLARVPQVTLAEALRQIPGFAVVGFDGLGYDPQIMVRGFYGGGEAEYVVVLVDGKPLNDVQSGLVAWDAIPLVGIERVEVVRGGASALWGDAAIAGVINVITRRPASTGTARWSVTGGSYGSWRGSAAADTRILGRELAVFGGAEDIEGFRDGAERTTGRAGATLTLTSGPGGWIRLSGLTHWREFEEPGPLLGSALESDRTASDAFHRFDHTGDRHHRLGVEGERRLGTAVRLSASVTGELRDTEAVRTIALAPDFADTKEHVLRTGRALGTAKLSIEDTGLPFSDQLVLGLDGSYAALDSKYYAVLSGDRAAYAAASGERGDLDAGGSGDRRAAAAFVQYTILPADAVRISIGARVDWLKDTFDARAPAPERLEASHSALSPRLGVNVQYRDAGTDAGRVYVTAGRSFKAPTLDQLFDQRRLPVPFPPFAIATSNALLDPQHGRNVEAGIYHRATLVPGTLVGELSLSVYQMDMKDEVDFDLQTLGYVNIGRSRHRGIEAGLTFEGPRSSTAFLAYTQQNATSRVGENHGRQLKAIPHHFVSGGLSAALAGGLEAGVVASHAREIFLDDANTLELPAYTRVDARLSRAIGGVRVFLDVRNLLDSEYSTTGFPDPSGSAAVYYHPAAGRTFDLGLRAEH